MIPTPLHHALARYLGQKLTPEVAADIAQRAAQPDESRDPSSFGVGEYRGYAFRAERFDDVLDELHPLHVAHWLETEKHRHGLPLAPDYDAMRADERAGRMVQFTARHGGELVGNLRMYLGTSRHSGTLFAQEDTYYLLPEHRKGLLAIRFWQWMESALQGIGVREIRTDSKLGIRSADGRERDVGRLNEYLGYSAVATRYVKVFADPAIDQEAAHVAEESEA